MKMSMLAIITFFVALASLALSVGNLYVTRNQPIVIREVSLTPSPTPAMSPEPSATPTATPEASSSAKPKRVPTVSPDAVSTNQ